MKTGYWIRIAGIVCLLNATASDAEIWGVKSHDPVSSPPSTLFHFPESGGALSIVGTVMVDGVTVDVDGLALDGAGRLYGFEVLGGGAGSRLLSISTSDATATAPGPILAGLSIRGAAFTSGGRLLALDATGGALLEFDPETGLPVGTATALQLDGEPFGVSNLVDLAEADGGEIVLARWNELYRLDAATGHLTLLHTDPEPGSDGIGIGAAGSAWASAGREPGRHVVYDVQFDDDIYAYDPAAAYARQTIYDNIIAEYNAGRGDLASAPATVVGVGEASPRPAELTLHGAHPNPFNPRTTIAFSLRAAGPVRLAVHDLAGREVRELASSTFAAGRHEVAWDGCDDRGRALPAGVYACRVGSAGEQAWVRLTLVK